MSLIQSPVFAYFQAAENLRAVAKATENLAGGSSAGE